MKRFLPALAICLTISALPAPSCPAGETAPAQDQNAAQKDAYAKNMEEKFRNIGRNLDELNRKAETLAEQAQEDIGSYLADAEKKRKTAARKLSEMRTESRKKWRRFTRDMNAAMDEFEQAYERARERFKEKE
ncbi:MAG: hypothetical protein A2010_07215 [Nitrospirae bacterium GWD2_57_9]|nr:MAG: hypothetical protein A2010_07215 [Nitrospirae bacterium GWD2_57_9]OGW50840.1 MAG: hypothetical protein A2078_15590 [Nitrospirae bacterium GWC2_57_9]